MSIDPDLQPHDVDAAKVIQDCLEFARVEVKRIALAILKNERIRADLGEPAVDELDGGSYLLRRENRTVALRPGVAGELRTGDLTNLVDGGVACAAIFVNIVECQVYLTPYETDLNVLREVADQLGI